MDEWRLPFTRTVGSCVVSLRILPYSLVEASSWAALKAAARKLNDECRVGATWGDITGGVTLAGQHKWIQISLVRRTGTVTAVADG